MTGSKRRKRGALDPDYRTKLWNNSRYAPKNSSASLSTIAARWAILLVIPLYAVAYFLPEYRPVLWSWYAIVGGLVVGFILWILIAVRLRRREYQRLIEVEQSSIETKPTRNVPQRSSDPAPDYTPRDFEHEVAWVFNTLTPYKAILNGGAGDGGIDIKLMNGKKLHGIVQCKRYDAQKALPPQFIRELAAVKQRHQVAVAYLVTTAYFSPATRAEAEHYEIKLIHGQKFAQMRQRAKAISRQKGFDDPSSRSSAQS